MFTKIFNSYRRGWFPATFVQFEIASTGLEKSSACQKTEQEGRSEACEGLIKSKGKDSSSSSKEGTLSSKSSAYNSGSNTSAGSIFAAAQNQHRTISV